MAVVLLIPHILMILHFALLVECQGHQAIHRLRKVHYTRSVLLLHLECNLGVGT